jgi:hypothetical protein
MIVFYDPIVSDIKSGNRRTACARFVEKRSVMIL